MSAPGTGPNFWHEGGCLSAQRHEEARCRKLFIYSNGTENMLSRLAKDAENRTQHAGKTFGKGTHGIKSLPEKVPSSIFV